MWSVKFEVIANARHFCWKPSGCPRDKTHCFQKKTFPSCSRDWGPNYAFIFLAMLFMVPLQSMSRVHGKDVECCLIVTFPLFASMPVCLHIAYAADDACLSGYSELLLNLLLYCTTCISVRYCTFWIYSSLLITHLFSFGARPMLRLPRLAGVGGGWSHAMRSDQLAPHSSHLGHVPSEHFQTTDNSLLYCIDLWWVLILAMRWVMLSRGSEIVPGRCR